MNVFPTRILLASDGSESAAHATEVAVELSKKTHSELHVLYVGEDSTALLYPQAADPAWVVQENLAPMEEQGQQFEQVARQTLDAEVQRVRAVGETVAQAHLRMGTPAAEIVELAEELEVGLVVVGSALMVQRLPKPQNASPSSAPSAYGVRFASISILLCTGVVVVRARSMMPLVETCRRISEGACAHSL